ncbi:MAG: helix-hairpin-helix domain-containing protein [Gemmatirosa sp.]|nr:helix-hairpin-helix domain-containing protein [Gemmatirosa sp.]
MTNGERKALAFLAGMAVLGAAARVALAPDRAPTRDERLALAAQIDAVDSARHAAHGRSRRDSAAPRRRRASTTSDQATPRTRPARAPASIAPARIAPAGPPALVDVDVADVTALESLPGIGPGLARRIAEDRGARGAFGSLAGLERVSGVGPKLAQRVAPYVTFSGVPRPSSAAVARPP